MVVDCKSMLLGRMADSYSFFGAVSEDTESIRLMDEALKAVDTLVSIVAGIMPLIIDRRSSFSGAAW